MKRLRFEQLEGRRLLAADFGSQVFEPASLPAQTCMPVEIVEAVELEIAEEAFEEVIDPSTELEPVLVDEGVPETDVEGEVTAEEEVDLASEVVLNENELRDPVKGTSGYFGVIDSDTTSKSISFTPSESGTVDVVTASSFGDSETRLEITNGSGELIAASMTEDLEGFQKLTFDVDENETYQIEVSSDEAGEGYFMVTVDFEAAAEAEPVEPEPVDLHANEIGETATELTIEEDGFSISSELETEEDSDAFRFVAPANGEVVLEMTTISEDHQSNATVSVYDSDGQEIVNGATNDEVGIRFDTVAGIEYQILVDSLNDVKSTFELNATMIPEAVVEELETDDIGLVEVDAVTEDLLHCEVGVDEAIEVEDSTENALVDGLFERLGSELADFASNDVGHSHRFADHGRGLWFGWF